MPTVSLCMITKNEEKCLTECLNSVKELVDEMIIVDTGSTDKTKEIAADFGARIFDFEWCDDFSAARNESLKHATGDWILVLDADEALAKKDCEKIKEIVGNASSDIVGFILIERGYTNNSTESGWTTSIGDCYEESKCASGYCLNPIVRLFKNNQKIQYKGVIHETITESANRLGKILPSNIPIHHYGKIDQGFKQKTKFYEKLGLKKIKEEGNYISYYELGRDYVGESKLDEAIQYLQSCVELNESFFDGWFVLGNVYLMKKNFVKAEEVYNKALALNKNNASLYSNMALVFISRKDYRNAVDYFIKSISINPKNASAHYNLGICFHATGNNKKAYLALKNAIELDPKYKNTVEFEW